jgi:hypothetical protein
MTKFALLGAAALVRDGRNAGESAGSDLQPRLLRSVLSERQLPKQGTEQSLHRRLSAPEPDSRFACLEAQAPARWVLNSIVAATAAAGAIANDEIQTGRRQSIGRPAFSLVRDTHFLDHPPIFCKLIACHDTQFLWRASAHREP